MVVWIMGGSADGSAKFLWPAWHPWMEAGLLFETIKNIKDESSKLGGGFSFNFRTEVNKWIFGPI